MTNSHLGDDQKAMTVRFLRSPHPNLVLNYQRASGSVRNDNYKFRGEHSNSGSDSDSLVLTLIRLRPLIPNRFQSLLNA